MKKLHFFMFPLLLIGCTPQAPYVLEVAEFEISDQTSPDGFQYLEIFCRDPRSEIRYTQDGTDPTVTHGILYEQDGMIELRQSVSVKAVTFRPGMPASVVTSYVYTAN